MRRYRRYNSINESANILTYNNGLAIYEDGKYVEVDGNNIHLTSKEFELLMLMAQNPKKAFTKKELYETVWSEQDVDGNNTVTVHIKEIREKLRDDVKSSKFIETVWGIGYRFIGEKII